MKLPKKAPSFYPKGIPGPPKGLINRGGGFVDPLRGFEVGKTAAAEVQGRSDCKLVRFDSSKSTFQLGHH